MISSAKDDNSLTHKSAGLLAHDGLFRASSKAAIFEIELTPPHLPL